MNTVKLAQAIARSGKFFVDIANTQKYKISREAFNDNKERFADHLNITAFEDLPKHFKWYLLNADLVDELMLDEVEYEKLTQAAEAFLANMVYEATFAIIEVYEDQKYYSQAYEDGFKFITSREDCLMNHIDPDFPIINSHKSLIRIIKNGSIDSCGIIQFFANAIGEEEVLSCQINHRKQAK